MSDSQSVANENSFKLSICIATFNRGRFISETLDSILNQLESGVELVVVDGASQDNTKEVMAEYLLNNPEIRYYREKKNSGVDADFDKAISYARGDYCWLMTDDDLLKPGAISRVMSMFDGETGMIVVNSEIRDVDMKSILEERHLNVLEDRIYQSNELNTFFSECINYLSFIGCVVIRRSIWLERDRESYYGSLFIHVGVICQKPLVHQIKVISEPLIMIRYGNAMWTSRGCEIWTFMWPNLIWSFKSFSEQARNMACATGNLKKIKRLFYHRALGGYTYQDYTRLVSVRMTGLARKVALVISFFPSKLANLVVTLFLVCVRRTDKLSMYDILHSQNSSWASRWLAGKFGSLR